MNLSRRQFLTSAGLGLLAFGLPPAFLLRAAQQETASRGKTLVVVFLRGGIDGLNTVIPFKDRNYYTLRPGISVREPARGDDRSLDLDGFFSLHPALAPIYPLYRKGNLALIHATGSPDNTRSHFDAEDYMETGTPGIKSTPDGWLNRYLQGESKNPDPFRAVALGNHLSRILAGPMPALTMRNIEGFRLRNKGVTRRLSAMYRETSDALLRRHGVNLFRSISALEGIAATIPASTGAYPRGRFGRSMGEIARLVKAGMGVEIAFTELGGWDTHKNQGGSQGRMARNLQKLAQGIQAFYRDLGDRMEEVVIITLSEFGRTVKENGNRGTDHGHANMMFVLGGKVQGGRVYGRWPGLEPEQRYEGRDLDLTTDYRHVCADVLYHHLGVKNLSQIFPDFRPSTNLFQWKV
ncbi:MAG: DUF1501 domain-containing protein [Deltaproteobacteria bacterium]|nr:DUF1501 domain-containing protein [Deltaproteobacteria bacterium]